MPRRWSTGRKKGHEVDHHDSGPEKSHGRIERRIVKATGYLDWFEPAERKHWLGLRSLVEITSIRGHKGEISTEKRYYLSTHAAEAAKLGDLVRRHWGIENRCHWVLDMTFDEDHCQACKGNAAESLALLRKLTLNLLRHDQTIKDTMRGKRIQAALSEPILETLLNSAFQNEVALRRGAKQNGLTARNPRDGGWLLNQPLSRIGGLGDAMGSFHRFVVGLDLVIGTI